MDILNFKPQVEENQDYNIQSFCMFFFPLNREENLMMPTIFRLLKEPTKFWTN